MKSVLENSDNAERDTEGLSFVTRAMTAVVLCLAIFAGATFVAPTQADAVTQGTLYGRSWDPYGDSVYAYGDAGYKNWACGLKDCANTKNISAAAYSTWGAPQLANRMKMQVVTGFDGWSLSVSVAFPWGVELSGNHNNDACQSSWTSNNHHYNSYSAWGEFCKVSTWGVVTKVWIENNVEYRIGWNNKAFGSRASRTIGCC